MTTPNPLDTEDRLAAIVFRGGKLQEDIAEAVTRASVSLSTDEVGQIELEVADPGLVIARGGVVQLGAGLTYQAVRLVVARISLGPGPAGTGGMSITARSELVHKLKQRRGPKVLRKVSPSQFVISELQALKASYVVQPSATRASVARDVAKAGEQTGGADRPSTWTTFLRLAEELGFLCFEYGGIFYFGTPTWLISQLPTVRVGWDNTDEAERALTVPSVSISADAPFEREVSVELPYTRAGEVRPGKALVLTGMPAPFSGKYLITSCTFDLAGEAPATVTAVVPRNPAPQGDPDSKFDTSKAVARNGSPKITEAQVPKVLPGGATLVYFDASGQGVALYSDGTVRDGKGTQPRKLPPKQQAVARTSTGSTGGSGGAAAATGTKSVNDFVTFALKQAGDRYVFGGEARLDDADPNVFDCSELIEWACARAGYRFVDGSANQIAACRRAGTAISVAKARTVRGAIIYKPGHIGISLGDGRTMEARNSRAGVGIFRFDDIKWTEGGLVPGLKYPPSAYR